MKEKKRNGFTQVSNNFLDYMGTHTEAEIKVYFYFAKWRNNSEDKYVEAALSTIRKYTGIKKDATITKAILRLVELGWIADIIHQPGAGKREGKNKYLINESPVVNVELLKRERARRNEKRRQQIEYLENLIDTPLDDAPHIDTPLNGRVLHKVIENTTEKEETEQTSANANAASSVLKNNEGVLVVNDNGIVSEGDKHSPSGENNTLEETNRNMDASDIESSHPSVDDRFALVVNKLKELHSQTNSKNKKKELERKIATLESNLEKYKLAENPIYTYDLFMLEIEFGLRR